MKATASRWIPQGSDVEAIERPDLKVSVYLYTDTHGRRCAVGYQGRSKKPVLHTGSLCAETVSNRLDVWIKTQEERSAVAAAEREAKRQFVCGWEVGTILYSNWGYEQTNVDYYEVIAVKGAKTVLLRRIEAQIEQRGLGATAGYSTPLPGQFVGEAFTVRARSTNDALVNGRKRAHVWHGRPIACNSDR